MAGNTSVQAIELLQYRYSRERLKSMKKHALGYLASSESFYLGIPTEKKY